MGVRIKTLGAMVVKDVFIVALIVVFVGACGKKNSLNESKKINYVHLIPDSLLDDSQMALKNRLRKTIIMYVGVQNNHFELNAKPSDFEDMDIPLEYYELLKKNVEENNGFIDKNKIEHVDEQFETAMRIMKCDWYSSLSTSIGDSLSSEEVLNNDVSKILKERFDENKDFEIKEINLIPDARGGDIVFVEYETEDGIKGNYVRMDTSLRFEAYDVRLQPIPKGLPVYLRCIPEEDCPYDGRLIWRDSVVTPLCEKCILKIGSL